MKINIDKVKLIPSELSNDLFGMCIYGELDQTISEWIRFHDMKVEKVKNYNNIYTDKSINDLFTEYTPYRYMDGFSPNLNKHIHLGHLSNLIIAKAFLSLGLTKETVSILGDTLNGEVKKEEALSAYKNYCNNFNYPVNTILMASDMKCDEVMLIDGSNEYLGTKVFYIDDNNYVVGIKSDGSTTYFYQDVALATKLNSSTLYITGSEQNNHFISLKKLFPHIHHVGIGLVKANGTKMASRYGNVIMADELLSQLMQKFNNDHKLCYNVLAGFILKSTPKSDKNINLDQIDNPLNSPGLYFSYTLSRLKSAGLKINLKKDFYSQHLQFKYLKSKISLSPNILFEELINHTKIINNMYLKYHIKDSIENQKMFEPYACDLLNGMLSLGMFEIDVV